MNTDLMQKHWDEVYRTKNPGERSWTQEIPQRSLDLIRTVNVSKSSRIIDVGGGDGNLVDCLLAEGFRDITVLDISRRALEHAQERLGNKAEQIEWICQDIVEYQPAQPFDLWHDRAVFHFLTIENDIARYVSTARQAIAPGGILIIATFSTEGPQKCSGLNITQYGEDSLAQRFSIGFEKIRCLTEDHLTQSAVKQNFLFCVFRRKHD